MPLDITVVTTINGRLKQKKDQKLQQRENSKRKK